MKKILIFNGSPRKMGDTEQLIQALTEKLIDCDICEVNTHRAKISPCVDCRWCWDNPSCVLKDEMQDVYEKIQEADWIILASPVHFDEVSGSLLQVMSRLQVFWMAKQKRNEDLFRPKVRKGAALLAAGGPGKAEPAHGMMKRLLHCMCATDEMVIHCKNTDRKAVCDNEKAMAEVAALAEMINGD